MNKTDLIQNISSKLNELHGNKTSYDTLNSNWSNAQKNTSELLKEKLFDTMKNIRHHVDDVASKTKQKLNEIVDVIEEHEYTSHNVTTKWNDRVFVEEEDKNVSKHLLWYYESFLEIDVFVPVVKIDLNETYNDLNWSEGAFNKVKEGNNIAQERFFIGTTQGVLRFSPSQSWPRQNDMFDSRLQSWFLEAASSKHDIALVIDRSGSVKGITLKTIRGFARLIIKLIPSNFGFNVFLANNDFKGLVECFGMEPLQGNENVKSAFLQDLSNDTGIEAKNRSNLNHALTNTTEYFFKGRDNEKMVILFTDGKMDHNTETLIESANGMKILILDFASPVSPGPNAEMEKIACKIKGQHVFVKDIGDWFEVVDKLFQAVSVRSVKSLEGNKFRWSSPTVTFIDRKVTGKSMVLSHPIFKFNETDGHSWTKGVAGIDILLDDFVSNYSLDAGSLAYEIISLSDGKVISHPRLLTSEIVPTLKQVELKKSPDDMLYPLPYLTDAPVTKVYKVERMDDGDKNYQLVIPVNDALNVEIDITSLAQKTEDIGDIADLEDNLFVRPFAEADKHNKNKVVECFENYKNSKPKKLSCDQPLKTLAKDMLVTKTTVNNWRENANFLITRSGLLWSTLELPQYKRAVAKNIPEYLEFAADPGKFQNGMLLVTRPFGEGVHLSKSVNHDTNKTHRTVWAVLGTRLDYTEFSQLIRSELNGSELDSGQDGKKHTYLLDHKGYVVYPKNASSSFFGEVHITVFKGLVEAGYYTNNTFEDSICAKVTTQKSAGYRATLFLRDLVTRLASILVSVVINSLFLVQRGLSFIMPEAQIVKNCHRVIHAYERNFTVTKTVRNEKYVGDKCEDEYGILCKGTYTVQPVVNTNLLLVAVQEVHPNCSCTDAPYTRIGHVIEDTLSYCEVFNQEQSLTGLNGDLVYTEADKDLVDEKRCKELLGDDYNYLD